MQQAKLSLDELSLRRIVGFACNQAFIFFLLYMGSESRPALAGASFSRADLSISLLFMVLGLFFIRRISPAQRNAAFRRPYLVACGVAMSLASLCPDTWSCAVQFAADGVLGLCSAFLLAAWGRSFGYLETGRFAFEVLAGSLLAALCCLLFSLSSVSWIFLLMRVFPIASAAWMDVPSKDSPVLRSRPDEKTDAGMLSVKVLCGTLCFGFASGMVEARGAAMGAPFDFENRLAMLLLAAFLAGALSLIASDRFGKGASLNKSYRLAVFLLLAGVLIIPVSESVDVPSLGRSVVLAGFLGLEAVLICLFLVVSRLKQADGAIAFSSGFSCLFAGELVGNIASTALFERAGTLSGLAVALAGAVALSAYIFLFTERDFDSLAQAISEDDSFERACSAIAADFALSKREAEILPYALRGRTSSRIADELGISKSTVDTHLRHIYSKCGVSGRQGLIDLKEGR